MGYDYLRSRPSKNGTSIFEKLGVSFYDVVDLPIQYLDLNPAVFDMLSSARVVQDGKSVPRYAKLADLIKDGYVNVTRWVENQPNPLNSLDVIYNIELALARFALKLRGTDFTVYDIQLEDLSLTTEVKDFLRTNLKIKTLGDLYIMGAAKFKHYFVTVKNGSKIKSDVLNAMMEFGAAPEKIYQSDLSDESGGDSSTDTAQYLDTDVGILDERGSTTYLFRAIKIALAMEKDRKKRGEELHSVKNEQQVKAPIVTYKIIPNAPSTASRTYPQPLGKAKSEEAESTASNSSNSTTTPPAEEEQPKKLTLAERQAMIRYEEIMSKVKFVGKFDYSKMIKLITEKYTNIHEFLREVELSSGILQAVYRGKELRHGTLLKISKVLGCKIEDLVSLNTNQTSKPTAESSSKGEEKPEYVANENATRSGRTVHVGGSVPKDLRRAELLEKPIEALGINWKYIKIIKFSLPNISTISDLVKYSKKELLNAGITYHIASQIVESLKFYGLSLADARVSNNPSAAKRKRNTSSKRIRDRKSEVNVTVVSVKPVHSQKLLQGSDESEKTKTESSRQSESYEANLTSPFDKDKRKNYYSTPNGYIKVFGERMKKYNPYPENNGFDSQM